MLNDESTVELFTDRLRTGEIFGICRNHIESLRNLTYLTSLEAMYPTQVRLHLRMMEWHIHNLEEALFEPHEHHEATK